MQNNNNKFYITEIFNLENKVNHIIRFSYPDGVQNEIY